MEELQRRRDILTDQVKRQKVFSSGLVGQKMQIFEAQSRIERLDESYNEYMQVQEQIELDQTTEAMELQHEIRDVVETDYFSTRSKLMELVNKHDMMKEDLNATIRSDLAATQASSSSVKLPLLNLPSFSGEYSEWLPFYDMFVATIHTNVTLSEAQKLQYLKSCLVGNASRIIHGIPNTNANYSEAWEILKGRFENKHVISESHVKVLFNQPVVASGSADGIRNMIDITRQNLQSLKTMGAPVESWDLLVIHMLCEKLDGESRKDWEMTRTSTEVPQLKELFEFLEKRCQALKLSRPVESGRSSMGSGTSNKRMHPYKRTVASHFASPAEKCQYCHGSHRIFNCLQYCKLSEQARREKVRELKLCENCLKTGHWARNCKSRKCFKCQKPHHTSLHTATSGWDNNANKETGKNTKTSMHAQGSQVPQVLLPTAIIKITYEGIWESARALLDSGSQVSFITQQLANKLGCRTTATNMTICGIGASSTHCKGKVQVMIGSYVDSEFQLIIEALVVQKLTGRLPAHDVTLDTPLGEVKLADPQFFKSSKIDVLLGADVYSDLVVPKMKLPDGLSGAQDTVFGMTICGPISRELLKSYQITTVEKNEQFDIKKFWEIEEVPYQALLTSEEKQCELHFQNTYQRDESGRFVVRLPFQESSTILGESLQLAMRRFIQGEKRLESKPLRNQMYVNFMNEYLSMGHMEKIPTNQIDSENLYYMPHHSVLKESSSTTKLRVVFDASAATTSRVSLNDKLMVGPTLQSNLWSILLRFRMHHVAFTADIGKMYRQIKVHEADRDYQRILWRTNSQDVIGHYRMTTVTYGTASAPYLATKCLQQLAIDEAANYPMASKMIKEDFYVDDLMSGASTIQEALDRQREILNIMTSGGFDLRKWSSNKGEILMAVPSEYRESQSALRIDLDEAIKTLGLFWHPLADYFSFHVKIDRDAKITKRHVLSEISKVYDPLGWLSPVIIVAKMLLQKMWLNAITWDEELPEDMKKKWHLYREQLPMIENIQIRRCIYDKSMSGITELHGFSDASETAYGAVVYLRHENQETGEVTVELVTAKTKVAPLKQVSLPRLELCAAVLLTKLMKMTIDAMKIQFDKVQAWTDSTIVLAWLAGPPNKWKTFVGNRVSEIQDFLSPNQWSHVSSTDNPADCASRGIRPGELVNHELWWGGPVWLSCSREIWPIKQFINGSDSVLEKRVCNMTVTTVNDDFNLLERFSSLSKLLRVTSYCIRFAANARNKSNMRSDHIAAVEINGAMKRWISIVQHAMFKDEINRLEAKKELHAKSSVRSLHPFLDTEGLLRVGGRLSNSGLQYDQKHPYLLPRTSPLTSLVIEAEHKRLLHAGPQLLLASLREKYWIIGARDLVRRCVHSCLKCFRLKAQTASQLMGSLPANRVEAIRPFLKTGVDYAGPIQVKSWKGRGSKVYKCYIALFVCLATKAIHLELVSDLTTDGFLAALRRFMSRRGKVAELHSDCGTNFKGAERELGLLLQEAMGGSRNEIMKAALSNEGITWHFIPPASPHFGGLWEAGVKSTKLHMRRIIGKEVLTFEEMTTVLTQIEACLNSRPLCPLSTDPEDLLALTPGHFLIGSSLTAIPEPDVRQLKLNHVNRWQLLQQVVQHFWKRWQSEYLGRLQQRPKWIKSKGNLEVNDLVLIKDENQPPLRWNMARILETHPGNDGHVRVVTVKTQTGIFKRPIVKLCRLPVEIAIK